MLLSKSSIFAVTLYYLIALKLHNSLGLRIEFDEACDTLSHFSIYLEFIIYQSMLIYAKAFFVLQCIT